jgi:hypothetical protein
LCLGKGSVGFEDFEQGKDFFVEQLQKERNVFSSNYWMPTGKWENWKQD